MRNILNIKNVLATSVLVSAVFGGTTAFANTETSSVETIVEENTGGITPDSFLYTFDKLGESLELALTFGDSKKESELLISFAEERLSESETMVDEGKDEYIDELVDDYMKTIEEAEETVSRIIAEDEVDEETIKDISDKFEKVTTVDEKIEEKLDEEKKEKLATKKEEAYLVASAIADIDKDKVKALKEEGLNYGQIVKAVALAEATGKTEQEIIKTIKEKKQDIKEVAQELGLKPHEIAKKRIDKKEEVLKKALEKAVEDGNAEAVKEIEKRLNHVAEKKVKTKIRHEIEETKHKIKEKRKEVEEKVKSGELDQEEAFKVIQELEEEINEKKEEVIRETIEKAKEEGNEEVAKEIEESLKKEKKKREKHETKDKLTKKMKEQLKREINIIHATLKEEVEVAHNKFKHNEITKEEAMKMVENARHVALLSYEELFKNANEHAKEFILEHKEELSDLHKDAIEEIKEGLDEDYDISLDDENESNEGANQEDEEEMANDDEEESDNNSNKEALLHKYKKLKKDTKKEINSIRTKLKQDKITVEAAINKMTHLEKEIVAKFNNAKKEAANKQIKSELEKLKKDVLREFNSLEKFIGEVREELAEKKEEKKDKFTDKKREKVTREINELTSDIEEELKEVVVRVKHNKITKDEAIQKLNKIKRHTLKEIEEMMHDAKFDEEKELIKEGIHEINQLAETFKQRILEVVVEKREEQNNDSNEEENDVDEEKVFTDEMKSKLNGEINEVKTKVNSDIGHIFTAIQNKEITNFDIAEQKLESVIESAIRTLEHKQEQLDNENSDVLLDLAIEELKSKFEHVKYEMKHLIEELTTVDEEVHEDENQEEGNHEENNHEEEVAEEKPEFTEEMERKTQAEINSIFNTTYSEVGSIFTAIQNGELSSIDAAFGKLDTLKKYGIDKLEHMINHVEFDEEREMLRNAISEINSHFESLKIEMRYLIEEMNKQQESEEHNQNEEHIQDNSEDNTVEDSAESTN